MLQFFLQHGTNGKKHIVTANNKTRASDVLKKLRNKGVDVNTLILKGETINGNTLIKNTTLGGIDGTGFVVKRHRGNANARGLATSMFANANARGNARGARGNARGANARGARGMARRRKNHNVNKVRRLLSIEYINSLKILKEQGLDDEEIKSMAIKDLQDMVDRCLISALENM